jgi:hypothetical protein
MAQTPTWVRVEDVATEEDWTEQGRGFALRRIGFDYRQSQQMWAIGDWLVQGEDCVLRSKKRSAVRLIAAELTGYSQRTLAMAASTSRRVDPDVRVDGLTWWHHLTVARLGQAEQATWLTRAAESRWTVAELRRQLEAQGLATRRSAGRRAGPLLARLVKLRRDDLTGELVDVLSDWLRREVVTTPPND